MNFLYAILKCHFYIDQYLKVQVCHAIKKYINLLIGFFVIDILYLDRTCKERKLNELLLSRAFVC